MKIAAINIIDYGKFDEKREIVDINPRVALFYGKNEAGKTTIFNLIKSLLYGFSPARAEAHPYSSRKNGRIEFSAKLTIGKEEIEVYRRLLSSPKGQMFSGNRNEELKNNPLPFAEHISSEIYNKIYSLRVEDLIEIQGKAWEEVQDKLLANYGNELLRNTREVLKELNEEAAEIYRESGRGNYLIKELENKLRELKKEKSAALSRQEQLRNYDSRLKDIDQLLEAIINERISLRTAIKKTKEVMPVLVLDAEIKALRAALVKEELMKGLPTELRQSLQEMDEAVHKLTGELTKRSEAINNKQKAIYEIGPQDELILENKYKINAYFQELHRLKTAEEELKRLKQEMERTAAGLTEEGRKILKEESSENAYIRIGNINLLELQAQLAIQKNLQQQLKEKQSILAFKGQQVVTGKGSRLYMAAAFAAVPLFILALLMKSTPVLMMAGFIGLFGTTGLINNFSLKKEYSNNLAQSNNIAGLREEISGLTTKLEKATADIKAILKGVPVPDIIVEYSQDVFLTTMMRIKDLYQLLEEKKREAESKETDYSFLKTQLESFVNQFYPTEYKGLAEGLYELKDRLDFLEKQILINEGLRQEMAILQLDEEEKQQQLTAHQERLQSYRQSLMTIGDGNIEEGLKLLESNQRLMSKIKLLEERLNEIPTADKIIEELLLLQEKDMIQEQQLEKKEQRLEDIEEELKNLRVERKEIEINMQQLMETPMLDELESHISVVEEALSEATIKRDRLVLLSELIRRADEEFRFENQPDVLKNASRYFNIITQKRYTGIFLDDNDGTPAIYLREADNPSPRRISDNESKGTLNQLYLSLRLSLIDHLDQGKEPLPICFDELLINWDEDRLDTNLQLLEELSMRRQIFIFTCHEWMAEKIEKYFMVERFTLN